jgi:MFS family permease
VTTAPHPVLTEAERAPYRRNLRVYLLFYALYDLQMWMAIWVTFLIEDIGLSFTAITTIAVPFWLIVAFGQVPAGAIADRWGRAWSLRAGSLVFGLSMLILGAANSLEMVIVSWVVWAFAMIMVMGADSALLHDSLKALGREREFEKWAGRTFAVRSASIVVATLAGGAIAGEFGLRLPILLGVIASTLACLAAFQLREPPTSGVVTRVSYRDTFSTATRTVWRLPAVRGVIAFVAVLLAGTMTSEYLLQPFLLRHDVEVGFTFSALQVPVRVMGIVGAVFAFWWVGKVGERAALGLLPLAVLGAYVGLTLVDSLGAIGFLMFAGLVRAAALPLAEGYINRRVPSDQRATILSLNHMAFALLVVFTLPLLGFAVDRWDVRWTFGGAAAVMAVLTLIIGTLWARAHTQPADVAPAGTATAWPRGSLLVGVMKGQARSGD